MSTQRRIGRRPKLNAYRFRRIVTALKAGNFVNVVAPYGGINRAIFHRWIERGEEEGSGRFYRFYRAVKKVLVYAEVRAVGIIRRARATILRYRLRKRRLKATCAALPGVQMQSNLEAL